MGLNFVRYLISGIIIGAVFIGQASSADRLPRLPKNSDYGDARKSLIALGWKPTKIDGADECAQDDDRCKDRPEMLSCSGTGMANCVFVWRRNDTLIEIVTAGEMPELVREIWTVGISGNSA